MSYQVLARKYRPRTFREMIGQEHVLKALINALDHNRLHHAYLFTGTRGVGKTTIARILAKCLNCETGVSSEPCGECSACCEIAEGRFVDLIEVDAASRTKVEDTRELLDNVQYAPTRGRYKIYLIDEVHMLSNHSFNALLKTLEEPPEHVKFLLATTDPQKLPVTILSRCLQFNLKNMNPERIVHHLQNVLEKEMVPFEETGLWQLARAADGSMRDALSLTDQAIAYGGGKVAETEVSAMLGTIDHQLIQKLVQALVDSNGQEVLSAVAEFAEHAPDFNAALADLLTLLHRIAIAQALPEALDNSYGDRDRILGFASQLPAEDVQLFYQTALIGRRDLSLAPDPRSGFEMTLLRMLAFRPQGVADVPTQPLPQQGHDQKASGTGGSPEKKPPAEPTASTSGGGEGPAHGGNTPPASDTSPSARAAAGGFAPQVDAEPSAPGYQEPSAPVHREPAAPAYQEPSAPAYQEPSARAHQQPSAGASEEPPPWHIDEAPSAQTAERPSEGQVNGEAAAAQQAPSARLNPEPAWAQEQPETTVADGYSQQAVTAEPATSHPTQGNAAAVLDVLNRPDLPVQKGVSRELANKRAEAVKPPVPSQVEESRPPLSLDTLGPDHWQQLFESLAIKGLLSSTVANCVLVGRQGNQLFFALDEQKASLFDDSHSQRLAGLLSDYFGQPVKVNMDLARLPEDAETPAMYRERILREKQAAALQTLKDDPVVQQLERDFGAQLQENSVTFAD
jgi:DNA polymerase-3 subunit gamma/tau